MPQYERISKKEIIEAEKHNPMKALLMIYADATLRDAEAQATGVKKREPSFHETGWEITLHDGSPKNAVGLWSCWLGDKFYLGYPKSVWEVPDELIMKTLGVEYASAVPQVDAVAVNDSDYEGEFKDFDKPLEKTERGQIIAYRNSGKRLWAKFWGAKEEKGGRVWIEKSDFNSYSYHMPIIADDELVGTYFGHDVSKGIKTFPFSCHNKYSPDSPTTDPEAVQKYRDGFLNLAVETSLLVGQPSKITVNYGFVMVPEDLEKEGYENIKWLKGEAGERKGWGNELVRAEKDGELIALKSGNSMVPWSTIRQIEVPKSERNIDGIGKIVRDSLTF